MENNIAVVGNGYWGKNLVRVFKELGCLRTICDINQKGKDVTNDYQSVLDDIKIKGIVVSTPAITHYEIAKRALEANKDVFVEKPLALTVEHGTELVKIAKERDLVLMVGHILEYHPAIIKLVELVKNGDLGKIRYIYSNRLNFGKIRTEEDIMLSFAPHDISAILLLMGNELPTEISSHGGYYLNRNIADFTLTNMEFKDGVNAHIFVSWLHPFKEQKLVVVGDKGMAVFNDLENNKLLLYKHEIEWVDRQPVSHSNKPEIIKISNDEPLKVECQDFIKSITERTNPKVTGEKGLRVIKVLAKCQESLDNNGESIKLSEETLDTFIHRSSIIDSHSIIGKGTKIWHFSHVMSKAQIGEGCNFGQGVFVGDNVKIGKRVKIQNNVSVYDGVEIEDDVFIAPSVVFTNVINPRAIVSRKDEYKKTLIKKGATIGANATIICGVTIGEYAFIGAGAVVTRDVRKYELVYESPARHKGWVCECGEKIVHSNDRYSCSLCGVYYKLKGDNLEKCTDV